MKLLHHINNSNSRFLIFILKPWFISRGQLPADAEFNFLDHAKRLDMYGVELHKARVFILLLAQILSPIVLF